MASRSHHTVKPAMKNSGQLLLSPTESFPSDGTPPQVQADAPDSLFAGLLSLLPFFQILPSFCQYSSPHFWPALLSSFLISISFFPFPLFVFFPYQAGHDLTLFNKFHFPLKWPTEKERALGKHVINMSNDVISAIPTTCLTVSLASLQRHRDNLISSFATRLPI